MKASDLESIPDPVQRLIQAHKFMQRLKKTEEVVAGIRDAALYEEIQREGRTNLSHLARLIGISQQRMDQLKKRAIENHADLSPPWDRDE